MAELTGESVEARMLEVEQASLNTEAQARLAQIRAELGLAPASGEELLKEAEQLQQAEAAAPAPAADPAEQSGAGGS
jgi:hypothetical protein